MGPERALLELAGIYHTESKGRFKGHVLILSGWGRRSCP